MADDRKGLVQTLVPLISALKDPNAHQVVKDRILNTSPHVFGHLLSHTDHIAPELIVGETLQEPVVVPMMNLEFCLPISNETVFHPFHNLGQRIR